MLRSGHVGGRSGTESAAFVLDQLASLPGYGRLGRRLVDDMLRQLEASEPPASTEAQIRLEAIRAQLSAESESRTPSPSRGRSWTD